jgi:hypothetical protein
MADCPYILPCPFFNDRMANMPSMAAMIKSSYCKGDYTECARYLVRDKLGKGTVPEDLFPNAKDRAAKLVATSPAAPALDK